LLLLLLLLQVYANVSTDRIPEQRYYLYTWFIFANGSTSSNSSFVLSTSTVAVTQGVPVQVSVSCSGMELSDVAGQTMKRYLGIVDYSTTVGDAATKQLLGSTAVVMQPY
jgi:hypothetical protein